MSNYKKIWKIVVMLRGNMDVLEYKNYFLGFIFYKYLSEKLEISMNDLLTDDKLTFQEACLNDTLKEHLKQNALNNLGYFIESDLLFSSIVKDAHDNNILEKLEKAFLEIDYSTLGYKSHPIFSNIFEDIDLSSLKLGKTIEDKNKVISNLMFKIDEIDLKTESENNYAGNLFEYLIGQFASSAGKKAGEFYTPKEVSQLLAKIVTLNKTRIKKAYDPTCGSGSLLLRVADEVEVSEFYGQELNQTTYNLSRMNMILHGIKYNKFEIKQGDSLEKPQHKDKKFEAIVANPPFSAKWSSDKQFNEDPRFSEYGKLAPKSKADYAFVQHMIYHLKEDGTLAVVLPHGVLFRGAAEETIRKYLIEEKNYLDAVIGLPVNLFYGTSIPTCILVFKKGRKESNNILFIDASQEYEKLKKQNKLRPEDIDKIITTYKNREEIEKYSHKATLEEIKESDYNLNIPRYVDTFEEEEKESLDEIVNHLEKLDQELEKVDKEIIKYCKKIGIKSPIMRK